MRKLSCLYGCVAVLSGAVSQPALADSSVQKSQNKPVLSQSGYAYPQVLPQLTGQPLYKSYPTNPTYYYPQYWQGQPTSAMPYPHSQAYPYNQSVYHGMMPMTPMVQSPTGQLTQSQSRYQPVQPNHQYQSPYNPNIAATPGPKSPAPAQPKKAAKPWGDTRHIWPDFYTDFTGDFWDEAMNAPRNMGYMPGGWRFPSLSTPDPVTVGDAVANQMPPIFDESANFINFAN